MRLMTWRAVCSSLYMMVLKDVDVSDADRLLLREMCKRFHSSVLELSQEYLAKEGRHNYVTPTSYLAGTSLRASTRPTLSLPSAYSRRLYAYSLGS